MTTEHTKVKAIVNWMDDADMVWHNPGSSTFPTILKNKNTKDRKTIVPEQFYDSMDQLREVIKKLYDENLMDTLVDQLEQVGHRHPEDFLLIGKTVLLNAIYSTLKTTEEIQE